MNWSVIAAVNNEQVLKANLLASPAMAGAAEIILQRNYASAATAYNAAISRARSDLLVFVHQDVYLPASWRESLEEALGELAVRQPKWGVLGAWGLQPSGRGAGYLYCNGLQEKIGRPDKGLVEVRTLDEVILILRKSSGLLFDENVPGFHLYGTDICLEAARRGMKSYAFSAMCIHNTSGYKLLPWSFWRCYFRLRRKWREQLPIPASCVDLTYWCWPAVRWNLAKAASFLRRRQPPGGRRVDDPAKLYRELAGSEAMAAVPHSG